MFSFFKIQSRIFHVISFSRVTCMYFNEKLDIQGTAVHCKTYHRKFVMNISVIQKVYTSKCRLNCDLAL